MFDVFCIIWGKVFLLMYLPFSRPILGSFTYRISSLFTFLLFRRTLADAYSIVEFVWFSYMHLFQKIRFFMRSNSEIYRNAGMISHHFSSMFITFSALISISMFFHSFLMEDGSQNGLSRSAGCSRFLYFSRPFPNIYFFLHFGRPLAHFWHPWASKWLTFGSPWLSFGLLWESFGSLLAPFGCLWLTFGTPFRGDYENLHKFHTFSWTCMIG